MKRSQCKTCGASEGFIVYRSVSGNCSERYESDGTYAEEQGSMYEAISHGEAHKRLECASCGGYYGKLDEVDCVER